MVIQKVGTTLYCIAKSRSLNKILYSTGGNQGTFLDALIDTYSKSHIRKKFAPSVNSNATELKKIVDEILKPVGDKYGIYGARIKSTPKIQGKLIRATNELDHFDAVAYINQSNFTNIVGDALGTRVILNDPKDAEKFMRELMELHQKGNLQIGIVENYHGKGIAPYLNENIMNDLQSLSYIDGAGKIRNTVTVNKLKPGGYTRTNMDLYVNGKKIELQIGGKHTTRLGEVEHYYYDMGQGANPDLSKLSDEQKELFFQMKDAYKNVKNNPLAKRKFDNYTTELWKCTELAEQQGLPFPQLPPTPKGIPSVLSGENLMKLEHNTKCNNLSLLG